MTKYILIAVILIFALAFMAKFAGPELLRLYVRLGIGDCKKVPVFCIVPAREITNPLIDIKYAQNLSPYKLFGLKIGLPRGFLIVEEEIKNKVNYKKTPRKFSLPAVYIFHKGPNFFMGLFPKLKAQGIKNDLEFIGRVMSAKLEQIQNTTDAFFVIMKGIFIPDLGQQQGVKMVKFSVDDKAGFINYNLTPAGNFFDGNMVDRKGIFLKIYIRDVDKKLDLDKFLAIISTAKTDQIESP